jgi:hypothetical protein
MDSRTYIFFLWWRGGRGGGGVGGEGRLGGQTEREKLEY